VARSDAAAETTKTSKADAVYAALKARILDGTYPPGFRLAMSSLATEFGVSPLPVREAVRRLEAESLVHFERNIGARVAGVDLHEYAWTVETLAVLEGAATGMAAKQLTADDIADARHLNARLEDCIGDSDPGAFRSIHQQLHEVLIRPCRNPTIVELTARSWARLRFGSQMHEERVRECVVEHESIVDLIEAGAPDRDIEHATRTHLLNSLSIVPADPDSPGT
jgi:DNA-binding GntR family transcriptional regulator